VRRSTATTEVVDLNDNSLLQQETFKQQLK
jgi:hypothetical protein